MEEQSTDIIQGTLDLLILKTLSLEPLHGFGIARRIEQISRGVFKVNPRSLLTAFQLRIPLKAICDSGGKRSPFRMETDQTSERSEGRMAPPQHTLTRSAIALRPID